MKAITIAIDVGADFKTVLVVCYDKLNGKYRSINLGKRMIAAQLYDSPEDIISQLEQLKEKGKIKGFDIAK